MFDFSKEALEKDLPTVGQHQATVTRVNVSDQGDVAYLVMDFQLEDGNIIPDFLTIKASKDSGRQDEKRKGIQRIRAFADAVQKDAGTLKSEDDIINAFTGAKVTVTVAHVLRNGIKTPVIKAFAKPATAPLSTAKA